MLQICKELKKWFFIKCKLAKHQTKIIFFKQRDVWWCSLGKNLGHESEGKGENFTRPVLVLKKLDTSTFIGLSLTSINKKGSWFHQIVFQGRKNTIMLNQIRILSSNRLDRKIGQIEEDDFEEIKRALKRLLGL